MQITENTYIINKYKQSNGYNKILFIYIIFLLFLFAIK